MSELEKQFGISEVAASTGLEPDTLRYFERQGILPAPRRDAAGRRQYGTADVDVIRMLVHLRGTGMPLAEIAQFTGADAEVADPSRLRLELLTAHRRRVEDHRAALDRALEVITRKIADHTDQATNSPETLERPDTTIAYGVQGEGPLVFLVGAPAGRGGFAALANELAGRFTVVTHDPRGIGASRQTRGMAAPTPQVLAQDLVGSAVLHEPPLISLLEDAALAARAASAFAVAATDPQRAVQEFFDLSGAAHHTGPAQLPPAHIALPPLPDEELDKNRYFLGRMAGPTVFYQPDIEALCRLRLIVCAGSLSHHQMARRAADALAARLRRPLVDMPGNHVGASAEPEEFARALVPLLER